jgi:DNA-binding response OmpR family regulator
MTIKVLLIDDDPAFTDLLMLVLNSQGMQAMKANSGKEGLELVHSLSPDVVILDLMMPEMDGWQVCSEIRSFSQVPILMLSALDSPKMVATVLDNGADDYLVKPVPSGILVARIHTLARRAGLEKNHKKTVKVKTEAATI